MLLAGHQLQIVATDKTITFVCSYNSRALRKKTLKKREEEKRDKLKGAYKLFGHTSVITGSDSSGSGLGVTDNDIHKSRSSSWLEM